MRGLASVFAAAVLCANGYGQSPSPECPTECVSHPITYQSGQPTPPAGVTVVWFFTYDQSGWAIHESCSTCQNQECKGNLRFAIYGTTGTHCASYGIATGSAPPGHTPVALSTGPRDFPFAVACNGTAYVFEMGVEMCGQGSTQHIVGATFECLCSF